MSWDPVYRLVKRIPRGRVTTYGELAKALRLPGGARAVGYAMAATPNGRGIPWHRVIGAGGKVTMPEPHASLQRRLLATEGVPIEGTRIDMKLYAWSPKSRAKSRVNSRAKSRKPKRKPARRVASKSRV
jgi:methylated-DNA-protein-cysteine methyltransferase related protein